MALLYSIKKEQHSLVGFALGANCSEKFCVDRDEKAEGKGTMKRSQGSGRWSDGGRNCRAASFPLHRGGAVVGGREEVRGSWVGCFKGRSLPYCLAVFCFPFPTQTLG